MYRGDVVFQFDQDAQSEADPRTFLSIGDTESSLINSLYLSSFPEKLSHPTAKAELMAIRLKNLLLSLQPSQLGTFVSV